MQDSIELVVNGDSQSATQGGVFNDIDSKVADAIMGDMRAELPDLNGEGSIDQTTYIKEKERQKKSWQNLNSLPTSSSVDLQKQEIGSEINGVNNFVGADNILMQAKDALVVQVGEGALRANISPVATNINFESQDSIGRIGINYLTPGSTYGFGIKVDGSHLLGKTVAIGANLMINKNLKEIVLNGVWLPVDLNVKTKFSGSYMTGEQTFNFYSGSSNANLSQASYYFSTQYIVPKEKSDYLHFIGVSAWSSDAKQTNNPDPIYSLSESANYVDIMKDPRKLSVGSLRGGSADIQVGLASQLTAKVSLGYEGITFPYSNGTQESNIRAYQNYALQYNPIPELAFQADYKMGVALNNILLSAIYRQWKIAAFMNIGVNGIAGNQGVMLSYSIPIDGKNKAAFVGGLTRPESIGNSKYILHDAIARPVQLPQAFLAKVDLTAVKKVASIDKSNLPDGASITPDGDLVIVVGDGSLASSSFTRNGNNYPANEIIEIAGNRIFIRTKAIPAPSNLMDQYSIVVTDTSLNTYSVSWKSHAVQ